MNNKDQAKEGKKPRERSSAYPQFNLDDCFSFTEKIFDLGPRQVLQDQAAKRAGYKNSNTGPFLALRAAAKYFGFVCYDKDYISVQEPLIKILLDKSLEKISNFKVEAVIKPSLYAKIIESYNGKQLPDEDDLAKRIAIDVQFGIKKEASKHAAKIFIETIQSTGILGKNNYLFYSISLMGNETSPPDSPNISKQEEKRINSSECLVGQNIRLDKYEITLQENIRIILLLPPTLSSNDKQRLKTLIDLIPEDNKTGENS